MISKNGIRVAAVSLNLTPREWEGNLNKINNGVMKIIEINNKAVAKLSDSPGKSMCEDAEYVSYLKKVLSTS